MEPGPQRDTGIYFIMLINGKSKSNVIRIINHYVIVLNNFYYVEHDVYHMVSPTSGPFY